MLNSEREKLVVDLYKNQNKSIREIAQEARMSFRDIGAILKKIEDANNSGNGNAIGNSKDNNNNKSPNEKATQAYRLFSKGKKLVEVSIELVQNLTNNVDVTRELAVGTSCFLARHL
jgi:hypothetical protein